MSKHFLTTLMASQEDALFVQTSQTELLTHLGNPLPTDPFIILALCDSLELHKICQSPDLEALKL